MAPILTMGFKWSLNKVWSVTLMASKGLPVASTPTRDRTYSSPLSISASSRKWVYRQSPVFEFSEEEALAYDDTLEPLEKKELPCQEEFYILSSAMLPE